LKENPGSFDDSNDNAKVSDLSLFRGIEKEKKIKKKERKK